jgi:cysteine desulfurase/selenocysteine lyase
MTVDDARRDQFSILAHKTFLDAACASLAPRAAADAIAGFLRQVQDCPARSSTDFHIALDAGRDAARPEAARLVGASADEIALVENTSQALTIAARAIPLEPGDNILIPDLEYLQVPLAWRQPPSGPSPEIRLVRNEGGTLPLSRFVEQIDGRSRAVVMSSVQWSNGYRADLGAIGELCRARGLWFVVDAIQQLGAFPIDVRQTPIDLLVCGGHKWLNAPFGAGFLYVRRDVLARLQPPIAGYLAVEPPEGGWGEYFATPGITPLQRVGFSQEARRYETGGTGNYPGAVGLAASLRLINELGPAAISNHIQGLTDRLIAGLDELGVTVVTPRPPAERAGIVTFGLEDVEREKAALEDLLDHRVMVSIRYTSGVGGVRVSCHFFNNADDIDRLLDVLRAWRQRSGRRS